jgi:hypothetical protein
LACMTLMLQIWGSCQAGVRVNAPIWARSHDIP